MVAEGEGCPNCGQPLVVGKTDARAEKPASDPYGPEDLFATMYSLMGIDPKDEVHTPDGRPTALVNNGKVIGELWDYLFRGEDIFPILREELTKRFPGIRFVTYDVFGNVHGPKQLELVGKVPDLLKQYEVDAVISAIGA